MIVLICPSIPSSPATDSKALLFSSPISGEYRSFLKNGMYPEKVKEALTAHGVKLFHALFESYPMLLELFPFKDDSGMPIQAGKFSSFSC